MDTAHVLVRALVHSKLDYCNAVLASLPANQLSRLQCVLKAAARLVLGLPGRASVSAAALAWLPTASDIQAVFADVQVPSSLGAGVPC